MQLNGEEDYRLNTAVEAARNAGVTVTLRNERTTVNINYDYSTRHAAETLTAVLAELGFTCTWSSSMIDGDDEEWTLTSTGDATRASGRSDGS